MKPIDDAALMKVFKVLLKDIKQKTEEKVYPIFPPEKIEIMGSGKIFHETKNGATNLRECLRQLGVTMYHLASGDSEHSKTSYQIDGYLNRPLDSKLWPVLALLLSGKAFSIPQIEEAISWKKKVVEYLGATTRGASAVILQNFLKLAQLLILASIMPFKKIKIVAQRNWPWILGKSALILAVFSALEIVWYWTFNWPFSRSSGLTLCTFLFIAGIIAINIATFDNDTSRGTRSVMRYLSLPLMIIAMLSYAATSFIAYMPTESGKTPVENYSVLVNRKTGDFIGRLPLNQNDAHLVWKTQEKILSINHFKYKVVPGIPLENYFERTYSFKDGSNEYKLPVRITYKIKLVNREEYIKAWKRWKNEENLENTLISEIGRKVAPLVNDRFHEILEATDKNKTADLLFNASLINQKKEELANLVLQAFRAELFKLKTMQGQEVEFQISKWSPSPSS